MERTPPGTGAIAALTLVGTLVAAACFYPGYLNGDSNWQYAQALSGQYDDMHPVVMTWLWARLDPLIEGSGGLFLLMSIGFFASLGGVLRAFTPSLRAFAVAALLIGSSVPVFSMLSQVHKDLGMVVGLLGAFALLVEAERRRSLARLLFALPLLFYALAVRHNGAAAVLPFALWLAWLLVDGLPPASRSRLGAPWRRLALGVSILAALFALSQLATRAIVGDEGRHTPFVQIPMAYDLVGISVRSGRDFASDVYYPAAPFRSAELRAIYSDKTCYYLYWGRTATRKIPFTRSPEAITRVRRAWLAAIAAEPAAWWAHRSTLFLAHLGIGEGAPDQTIEFSYRGLDFDYRGPVVFDLSHTRALVSFFEGLRGTLFFRPWPYLLAGLLALAGAWLGPSRHRFAITLLAASSAAYVAPFLVIGVASEFRYMWWPIVAAILQLTLLVTGRLPESRAR